MIAMSIFAVMSVMIMNVYFNISNTSRRLSATRELSETAREITERIAQDVKEKWISLSGSRYSESTASYELWANPDYTASWGELLAVGSESAPIFGYFFGSKSGTTLPVQLVPCTSEYKNDIRTHCGLYRIPWKDGSWKWDESLNLADSFIPDESKKRVKIEDLKFFISWNDFTAKKVTLNFTLSLMPRIGVPQNLIGSTKLRVQTTISERGWKKN